MISVFYKLVNHLQIDFFTKFNQLLIIPFLGINQAICASYTFIMADLENSNGYNQERQLFLMNDSWNRMTIATDEISRFSNSTSPTTTFFESEDSKIAQFAMTASWIVNWLLLFAKIVCLVLSNSLVVAASLADSAVDLLSQAILSLAERYMGKHNPDYPVGRSRLEALSVLAAASIMSMASIEVSLLF